MKISDLKPAIGSKHRRKIVGRGRGSAHGGSSTRGMKGQNSRSGRGTRPGFEGGQMPLARRIPKRGFTNIFKKEYEVVNLKTLERIFEPNTEITRAVLKEKGLIRRELPIKILGDGDIKKALKITANKFSKSAIEKISAAGGSVVIESRQVAK
jgi:large subunit ribosomal protein L15